MSRGVGQSAHEQDFEIEAVAAGYEVIKYGWPDFMLIKNNEIVVVELKQGDPYVSSKQRLLNAHQLRMLLLLEKAGLKVRVAVDDVEHLCTITEFLQKTGYRMIVNKGGNSVAQMKVPIVA